MYDDATIADTNRKRTNIGGLKSQARLGKFHTSLWSVLKNVTYHMPVHKYLLSHMEIHRIFFKCPTPNVRLG